MTTTAKRRKPAAKRSPGYQSPWKPTFPLQAYRMAKAGMEEKDIAQELGVNPRSFRNWKNDKPELAEALDLACKELKEGDTFPKWVYNRLSPALREVWDKIAQWDVDKVGVAFIENLLSDHGVRTRQQLFLHALVVSAFSPSQAMYKVNITRKELNKWLESDVEFAELVEEVQWHKGNFFEESLVKMVAQGNPAAVLFANRTYNAKRGYAGSSTLNVNHSGEVLHGVVDLVELMEYLSENGRLELLGAIRKREEMLEKKKLVPNMTEILEQQIANVPEEASHGETIPSGAGEGG